jgi:hypothetical protein
MSEELNEKIQTVLDKAMENLGEDTVRLMKDFDNLEKMDKDTRAEMTFEYYKQYSNLVSEFLSNIQKLQHVAPAMFRVMDVTILCLSSDDIARRYTKDGVASAGCLGSPENVASLIMKVVSMAPELKPLLLEKLNG